MSAQYTDGEAGRVIYDDFTPNAQNAWSLIAFLRAQLVQHDRGEDGDISIPDIAPEPGKPPLLETIRAVVLADDLWHAADPACRPLGPAIDTYRQALIDADAKSLAILRLLALDRDVALSLIHAGKARFARHGNVVAAP